MFLFQGGGSVACWAGLSWDGLAWAANYPWTTVLLVLETALLVTGSQRGQEGDGDVRGRKSLSPLSRKFQSRSFVSCAGVLLLVIMLQCCSSAAVLQCSRVMKCNELRTAVTGGPSTTDSEATLQVL